MIDELTTCVTPAKAGVQKPQIYWIPAFAGMTTLKALRVFGVFPKQWLLETTKIALKLTRMCFRENDGSLLEYFYKFQG